MASIEDFATAGAATAVAGVNSSKLWLFVKSAICNGIFGIWSVIQMLFVDFKVQWERV